MNRGKRLMRQEMQATKGGSIKGEILSDGQGSPPSQSNMLCRMIYKMYLRKSHIGGDNINNHTIEIPDAERARVLPKVVAFCRLLLLLDRLH